MLAASSSRGLNAPGRSSLLTRPSPLAEPVACEILHHRNSCRSLPATLSHRIVPATPSFSKTLHSSSTARCVRLYACSIDDRIPSKPSVQVYVPGPEKPHRHGPIIDIYATGCLRRAAACASPLAFHASPRRDAYVTLAAAITCNHQQAQND